MPFPLAAPESVGLSTSRLAGITAWQQEMVSAGKLPCAHTVVARRGKVVYSEMAGEQSPGTPSRRRDCHFAGTPCLFVLKHLLKVEGGGQQNDCLADG